MGFKYFEDHFLDNGFAESSSSSEIIEAAILEIIDSEDIESLTSSTTEGRTLSVPLVCWTTLNTLRVSASISGNLFERKGICYQVDFLDLVEMESEKSHLSFGD